MSDLFIILFNNTYVSLIKTFDTLFTSMYVCLKKNYKEITKFSLQSGKRSANSFCVTKCLYKFSFNVLYVIQVLK